LADTEHPPGENTGHPATHSLEGQSMTAKITSDVLEGYIDCKLKGHLKQAGQHSTCSDYEALLVEARSEVRLAAVEKILARHSPDTVVREIAMTAAALKRGPMIVLDAVFEDDTLSLRLDGLKRVDGPSKLGDFHYVPVLFDGGRKLGKRVRLLLEVYALLLSRLQGRMPAHGIVWHGKECRAAKVRLGTDPRQAERLLQEVQRLNPSEPPRLVLNDHCQICEFRQRCHEQAVREDNLSLLRGLGEKEVRGYARKGILTLTQLAHTFRPRRKGKRQVRKTSHRYHALQALAVRDKRIYVFGTPELADSPVRIYLDMEGKPDEGFVYLIGMIVVKGGTEQRFSFWADDASQEQAIFEQFLAEIGRHDNFCVYCYGGYERAFLRRMRKVARRKGDVDRVLDRLVNVLSVVYAHVYFPTYSNGLKDVAGCLGCSWTEPEASGVQSIVWRTRWEQVRGEEWKQRLLTYNLEDCAGLRKVTELVHVVRSGPGPAPGTRPAVENGPLVAWVEELDRLGAIIQRGKITFFHPDYQHINDCAHFDYQRQRVYVRTSKLLKKNRKEPRRYRNRKLRVSQRVQIISRKCPACGGMEVIQWPNGKKVTGYCTKRKKAFDLVFSSAGIKRKVIECRTSIHECCKCGEIFVPDRYQRLAKHFHGLMSWAMHEYVAHRIGCPMLKEMLRDFFGLSVCQHELNEFKRLMARYYRPCYKRLLAKILSGRVLHIDETEVKLRTGKAYVWVFATAEEVVYMFRPTREGDFLAGLLKDFHGVLVSDFYAAYDAIDCPQQKCLIHLIRDMNQELLNNPFDAELQTITGPFGVLLREIVTTIDQHGLRHRYLKSHQRGVDKFFESLATRTFRSEAAEALRERLFKNRDKLFTFLGHDGVPWNNNNAENAIRQFAYYREDRPGRLREPGLKDYLVLLSLYQTCRYRGVSFLKFLLSKERGLDAFCQRPRRIRRSPVIEVYPKGVGRPDFGPSRADAAKEEMRLLQGTWGLAESVTPDGTVISYQGDTGSASGGRHQLALIFKGDTVNTDGDGPGLPDELEGQCRLNPKRRPKIIDFVLLDTSFPLGGWKGRTTPGIYELEGDRLRLCLPEGNGKNRPAGFEPGGGNRLYTFRRKEH
jgi:predicted RecB family nuclease